MELNRKAKGLAAAEHSLDLRWREGNFLAEGVHRIRKRLAMRGFERWNAYVVDIRIGAPGVFRRHSVRAKKGRADPNRQSVRDSPRGAEHAKFGFNVQPVTGLDLDRGDALGHKPARTLKR